MVKLRPLEDRYAPKASQVGGLGIFQCSPLFVSILKVTTFSVPILHTL